MGLFDKLKKVGDLVETVNTTANTVSKRTVDDYGEPVYSLYTALELGKLHRRIDITDEDGNLKYYTKSSVIAVKHPVQTMPSPMISAVNSRWRILVFLFPVI